MRELRNVFAGGRFCFQQAGDGGTCPVAGGGGSNRTAVEDFTDCVVIHAEPTLDTLSEADEVSAALWLPTFPEGQIDTRIIWFPGVQWLRERLDRVSRRFSRCTRV